MSNKYPTSLEELIEGSLAGIEQGWLHYVIFSYHDCGGEIRISIARNEYEEEED